VWFIPQGGVICRHLFQARQGEKELDVGWFLVPTAAIVVEGGNPILNRHECGLIGVRHRTHKVENPFFRISIVPGR
jgi:hypothetical protein